MKTLKFFSIAICFMAIANFSFAQSVTETFKVSGNCGMCKNKIEKAAKDAGATSAEWDADTKDLKVTFNSSSTNTAKIQQKIAKVGYDNAGATATKESYDKLHGCCKYERATTNEAKVSCCKDGKCDKCEDCGDCCKDGKCTKNGDCCKDGKGKNHHKEGETCDKDGKCSHEGASCCKKSE